MREGVSLRSRCDGREQRWERVRYDTNVDKGTRTTSLECLCRRGHHQLAEVCELPYLVMGIHETPNHNPYIHKTRQDTDNPRPPLPSARPPPTRPQRNGYNDEMTSRCFHLALPRPHPHRLHDDDGDDNEDGASFPSIVCVVASPLCASIDAL